VLGALRRLDLAEQGFRIALRRSAVALSSHLSTRPEDDCI